LARARPLEAAEGRRGARKRVNLPAKSHDPEVCATEQAFIDFGCGECIDSFIGFGVFKLARDAGFLPDALFSIFSRVLSEEARHITFFVNWLAYERAQRIALAKVGHVISAARGYYHGVRNVIETGRTAASDSAPGRPGSDDVFEGLTVTRVLEACLSENDRLMSAFDPRLVRPKLMPRFGRFALAIAPLLERSSAGRERVNVKEMEEQDGRAGAESRAREDLHHGVRP